MAQITINEISQNYSYRVSTSSFCTVALPITACWGPAFVEPATTGMSLDETLESTAWHHFAADQKGLESFIATYRGASSNYRTAKDYSYQMALTLLSYGYDILVCRLTPGAKAQGTFTGDNNETFTLTAKYPGTFGNSLLATLAKVPNKNYWNLITYVIDAAGVKTASENLIFTFDIDSSTDTVLHIDEVDSAYFDFACVDVTDNTTFTSSALQLTGGSDKATDGTVTTMMQDAVALATTRYGKYYATPAQCTYVSTLAALSSVIADTSKAAKLKYNEWLYTSAMYVYDLLKDKLAYNPARIISPGWDDQNITELNGTAVTRLGQISPLHIKLMDTAALSRCGTALVDIPKSLPRSAVWNDSTSDSQVGYAQLLARYASQESSAGALYQTHSALFAPWGQYTFTGTTRQCTASPSFLALMIQRAMILNQAEQYEWILPRSRRQGLAIGKMDYVITKKVLDTWQSTTGVGVNIITDIPDMGTSIWGNSTLFEVPPATYQALANLSTRYLVNAIENVVYRVGVSITFQYNNDEAYSTFYAGVTPLLDTMKNCGAIEGYRVEMSADIDGTDSVNANTIVGKILLQVNGVVNDIKVDLVCLPPSVDLTSYT